MAPVQHSLEPLAQLVELPDPKELKHSKDIVCIIPGPQAVSVQSPLHDGPASRDDRSSGTLELGCLPGVSSTQVSPACHLLNQTPHKGSRHNIASLLQGHLLLSPHSSVP